MTAKDHQDGNSTDSSSLVVKVEEDPVEKGLLLLEHKALLFLREKPQRIRIND
ncbi:hypothetical protein VKT23_018472 [Stygiomarasmius scandens]|uniref:Uncharacterized protein n=1 Tax=Marasmiellus scandens TaxID=2682957 RepID=A0ABR1IP21_9AGAR